MSLEQDDQDNDQVELNQDDEQGNADFEAAFNSARSNAHAEGPTDKNDASQALELDDAKPNVDPAAAAAAAEADAAAQAAAVAAAAAAEDDAPVSVSRKDFNRIMQAAEQVTALQDELRTTRDKTAGRLGNLQQMVEGFKAQASKAGPGFSVKQLTRLQAEFPELANLLVQDLADATGAGAEQQPAGDQVDQDAGASGAAAPGADAGQDDPFTDPRVQERLQQQETVQRQLHATVVDKNHPDWRDMVRTPEFAQWRQGLPEQAKQLLATSWDSSVLTDAFADFKKHLADRQAAASASKERDKRLADAVPPTSGRPTGQHAVDEDAAFMAGFNKVNGRT